MDGGGGVAAGLIVALLSAADAGVIVAFITVVVGPIVVLGVSSLKRIRNAAESAAHNTQPNGVDDGGPSPYDTLIRSHEYTIGLIHSVAEEARAAARAAVRAQAAGEENARVTREIAAQVVQGFSEAKTEREELGRRLDKNITEGAAFATAIISGALEFAERLDALDGGTSSEQLHAQVKRQDEIGQGDKP